LQEDWISSDKTFVHGTLVIQTIRRNHYCHRGCTFECSFLAFTPSHLQNSAYIPVNRCSTAFYTANLARCNINAKFPECALQVVRAMTLKPELHSADRHGKWSNLLASTLAPFQKVLHAAARLVLNHWPRDHVSAALWELHWLQVTQQIDHKLCLLIHKSSHGQAPEYISNTCT